MFMNSDDFGLSEKLQQKNNANEDDIQEFDLLDLDDNSSQSSGSDPQNKQINQSIGNSLNDNNQKQVAIELNKTLDKQPDININNQIQHEKINDQQFSSQANVNFKHKQVEAINVIPVKEEDQQNNFLEQYYDTKENNAVQQVQQYQNTTQAQQQQQLSSNQPQPKSIQNIQQKREEANRHQIDKFLEKKNAHLPKSGQKELIIQQNNSTLSINNPHNVIAEFSHSLKEHASLQHSKINVSDIDKHLRLQSELEMLRQQQKDLEEENLKAQQALLLKQAQENDLKKKRREELEEERLRMQALEEKENELHRVKEEVERQLKLKNKLLNQHNQNSSGSENSESNATKTKTKLLQDDDEEHKDSLQAAPKKEYHGTDSDMDQAEEPYQPQRVKNIVFNPVIDDMRVFLNRPVPVGTIIQCTIKRDNSGFNRFYPKYHLCLSNGLQHLMTAKKLAFNKTSHYALSLQKNEFKRGSKSYLGKCRSNFLGTEFHVYDDGMNPKKSSNYDSLRKQLCVVVYDTNLMGTKGPRKMKILIPELKTDYEAYEFKPIKKEDGMINCFKTGDTNKIRFLFNKQPRWNEENMAYVLNFDGRVDKPSVKNFQLVEEEEEFEENEQIILQFGRVLKSIFSLDICHPFSPIQAFGIALTSFDYKLACE